MGWLWACECRGVGADKAAVGAIMHIYYIIWIGQNPRRADKSAMGAINRPLRPVHVMRISGGREDKSRTLLYQVYRVYRAACEPAVFFSNRMSRVSRVSGVSDKFEWKWLTVSEFQEYQVYQVYQVYQTSLSGSGSLFQSIKCIRQV